MNVSRMPTTAIPSDTSWRTLSMLVFVAVW